MARKEKFGKLVLLEEMEGNALLGAEYRAAKLGVSGLEKIVTLLRLRPDICSHTEAARSLMDQVKLAAQLQNPNIVKVFGIGKVESSYYITYEFVEGRSLQQMLDHCRQEHYPFAVDHALLIASKVCAALEYAHSRRNDSGARFFHGLLTPDCVLVSYEGEVRLRGFGYWPSQVRQAGLLRENERRYVAPEQASGSGDPRSDVFGLGAILFETLTGQPPAAGTDAATLLASARLSSPTGDDDSVPKPIAEILLKALALDPGSRYGDVADLRKAIDTLLFSGDFTPTTFNLAFFMHSLFREDMEREARALKEEREASYAEYLAEDGVRGGASARPAPAASSKTEPIDLRQIAALRGEAAHPDATVVEAPDTLQAHAPQAPVVAHEPAAAHPPHGSSPGLSPREAASSFTFHKDEPAKGKTPLVAGVSILALLAAAGGGWYFLQGRAASPPTPTAPVPSTLSPEVLAAQERVKELEQKLAALEAEKLAAESKAADDAKQKVEAQAKAKGQAVDQAALAQAQEEARQKARLDEERRQREELRRVEEQKRAEEARLLEERRRADEAAALERAAQERAAAERAAQERAAQERAAQERAAQERAAQERAAAEQAAAAAQTTPAPTPVTAAPVAAPPAAAPAEAAVRPGMLVSLDDPGVIAPILERKPPLAYPPIALRQRVEGSVDLSVLVDERGNVTDAKILSAPGGRTGLPQAAAEYARRWKFRPATKDGVPVKVWRPVTVAFKLP